MASYLEDLVLLWSSPDSGSYGLFHSSSTMVPEPLRRPCDISVPCVADHPTGMFLTKQLTVSMLMGDVLKSGVKL